MTNSHRISMQNKRHLLRNSRGFSLIEIIVVIVILGVLAIGISTFIQFGTQIYTDATDREEVVSSARFAVERLNREIRAAVPNSIRLTSNGLTGNSAKQCIEFTPLVLSTVYTSIAVAPDPPTDEVKVIAFDESLFNSGFDSELHVGVYLLNSGEFYDGSANKIFTLENNTIVKSGNEWTIKLDALETFAEDSPTNRVFFFNNSVSYCVQSGNLTRHTKYSRGSDNTPLSSGVLMAENLTMYNDENDFVPPFWLTEATQLRNSMVLIKFTFSQNNERIVFNNEIQVPNVP